MAHFDRLREELEDLKEKEAYFRMVKDGAYWTWLDLAERIVLLTESHNRQVRIKKIEETLNRVDDGQVRLVHARFS